MFQLDTLKQNELIHQFLDLYYESSYAAEIERKGLQEDWLALYSDQVEYLQNELLGSWLTQDEAYILLEYLHEKKSCALQSPSSDGQEVYGKVLQFDVTRKRELTPHERLERNRRILFNYSAPVRNIRN